MMWSFVVETSKKRNQEDKVGGVYAFYSQFHGRLVFCFYVLFKGLLEGRWPNTNIHIFSPLGMEENKS